jgi:hypothetical protein
MLSKKQWSVAGFERFEPGQRLTCQGNVGADWLFAGTREFHIDAQPDRTVRFTHVEDVRGVLFPLFRAVMGSAIQRHHDALNVALTQRAERRAASEERACFDPVTLVARPRGRE